MMKRFLKSSFALLLCCALMFSSSGYIYATSSPEYAWSVGVNHVTGDGYSGDFTPNVHYSAICYGMIPGIEAFYTTAPTINALKGTSPNGVKKLAGRLVFLTGHASPTQMVFGDTRKCAVTSEYDFTSTTGYQVAGLKSIGNLNTVDLMSFFGCSTAGGVSNFASVAVSLGANSAIGFTDSIISRTGQGALWTRRLHDYLATGKTIQQAITYATADAPSSTTAAYVKAYGDLNNIITDTSAKTAVNPSQFEISTNVDPVEINVAVSGLQNGVFNNHLGFSTSSLAGVVDEIKRIAPDFDLADYRVTVNMFSEDGNTGVILFTYCIDERIVTNHAYAVSVVNGFAKEIIPSFTLRDDFVQPLYASDISESELISLVDGFEMEMETRSAFYPDYVDDGGFVKATGDTLVDTYSQYFYDYSNGELTYSSTEFYFSAADGVYSDVTSVWYIS